MGRPFAERAIGNVIAGKPKKLHSAQNTGSPVEPKPSGAAPVAGIQALNLDLLLGMAKHGNALDLINFAERHGVIIEDHPKNRTMRCWREAGKETGQAENQAYEDIRSAFLGALVVLEENLRAKGGSTK